MSSDKETHTMGFNVQGKMHTLKLRGRKFDTVVDGIDKMIHDNKSIDHIKKKYANAILDHKPGAPSEHKPKPSKTVTRVKQVTRDVNDKFDKKAYVAQFIKPGLSIGQIVKAASAEGKMTAANARYLVSRHMDKAFGGV